MSEQKYKLTYFPCGALGEPIRFLITYGGIDFDDVKFNEEDWPALKPTMPFGQVPVLEYNGIKVGQSMSIARYFAKKVKLNGADEWEDLQIDSIIDCINDLRIKMGQYHYEQDAAVKEVRKKPLFSESIPFYLGKFEEIVGKNDGHLAVKKLTWADFYFVAILPYLNSMAGNDIISKYPNLKGLKQKIEEIPAIKSWIEKRTYDW